jgi:Tfp pilus assembly protein PilF
MAMSTDSSFARLHYIIGRCFLEKGNVNQAYMELTQALKSDPSIYDAWAPLARAALSVGDMKIAYTAAAMMVIKDKSDQAQLIFAKAAIAMGNEKEARKTLTEVIKNSPRNAEALALMSLIEERTGHSKEAQQYHDKAMAIDPSIYSHIEFVRP